MGCPTHTSKQAWDLSMLTLIVYSCVLVPFRIGMSSVAEGTAKTMENVVTVSRSPRAPAAPPAAAAPAPQLPHAAPRRPCARGSAFFLPRRCVGRHAAVHR